MTASRPERDAVSPFAPDAELVVEHPQQVDVEAAVEAVAIESPPIRRHHENPYRMGIAFHIALLIMSMLVLGASIVLDISQDAITSPISAIPLPGLCTFKRLTGVDCPGCGLTRCFVSISHGRFQDAWSFNPAGLFLYVAVVFQIPYRIVQILRMRRGRAELDIGFWGGGFLVVTAVVMFVQWAARASMSL